MATLVQFLAAGVNGAASGTATFLLRGTSSSAATVMYNDFEATTQPGSNVVTLDSNGAAEVYCDAYCDIELRSSSGTLLRTVTIGNSAPLVEVRSTSFTGTAYDGSPSNTIGEPITLKAILDKWITSAGASNWQVLLNGSATNIQTALAGFVGLFINVKAPAYGATGDNATDDTTAITAAIAAADSAGGGIVFFPPGTYVVSALTIATDSVVLMGCGSGSSILRGTSAGDFLLKFTDNTVSAEKRITGLGFTTTATYQAIIELEESQSISIDYCYFGLGNVEDAAIKRLDVDGGTTVHVNNCVFDVFDASSALLNLADDGETFFSVAGCTFVVSSSFTGAIITGPDFSVSQCNFDASAVTSGVYHHIDAHSNEAAGRYLGSFVGNKFYDGGSDGFVFNLDGLANGSVFSESSNEFVGFTDPTDLEDPGHIYDNSGNSGTLLTCQVVLGSRIGKTLRFTTAEEWVLPFAQMMADTVILTFTGAATFQVDLDGQDFPGEARDGAYKMMPPGARTMFVIINDSGGTEDVAVVQPDLTLVQYGAVADGFLVTADVVQVLLSAGVEYPAVAAAYHNTLGHPGFLMTP